MKKVLLVLLVVILFSSFSFAAVNNVCENIHVSTQMQETYLGGSFGQEICLSGVQSNQYFVNYKNGSWTWIFHQCTQPKWEQNLLRFFYCGGLS